MKKTSVLVIGASGTVGSEVSRLLHENGFEVRETTSRKDQTGHGRKRYLNLATGEGLEKAFEGIDRAFLMSPAGYANQHKILSPLIQETKRRNLSKVVLMTAMGANAVETSPLRQAELELEKSGLNYTIIRPNWFMQNFNSFWIHGIKTQGKILLPAGKAQVSFIDSRDIAAVAAKLFETSDYSGQALDLTGPNAIDHHQVAKAITEASRKRVSYEEISPETLKAGLLAAGLPEDYSNFLLMIFGALKAGYSAPITDHVKKILGREPRNILQYTEDFKQAWA
jgi:uncharacterized protein YbjT (DUF2867 family)